MTTLLSNSNIITALVALLIAITALVGAYTAWLQSKTADVKANVATTAATAAGNTATDAHVQIAANAAVLQEHSKIINGNLQSMVDRSVAARMADWEGHPVSGTIDGMPTNPPNLHPPDPAGPEVGHGR